MGTFKKKMWLTIALCSLSLVLVVGTIVAVLASNNIIVNSNVSVQYDSTINANVSANYWMDNASLKTNFIADQPISVDTAGSPSAISLDETDRYVIFEYVFTNNMQNLDAYGKLTYADDLDNDDTNIIVGYYISDTEVQISEIESKTFDESHVEGVCLGNVKLTKNAKTYVYIKARIDKLENDGEFSGTYHWDFSYDMYEFATDQAFFEFEGNTLTKYLGGAGDTVIVPSSYTPASASVAHMSASNVDSTSVAVVGIANNGLTYWDSNRGAYVIDPSVTEVVIPASVRSIGSDIFANNGDYVTVRYNGDVNDWFSMSECATSIYRLYLDGVYSREIEEITIPDGKTTLKAGIFYSFGALKTLNIPASITTIECDLLSEIGSLDVINYPGSVEQWLTVEHSDDWRSSLSGCLYISGVRADEIDYTIPAGTRVIEDVGMYRDISSIIVPTSVVEINGEFSPKIKYLGTLEQWRNVSYNYLDNGIIYIGDQTLANIYETTTEYTIPSNVTRFDYETISSEYTNLQVVNVPATVTTIGIYGFPAFSYRVNYLGTIEQWLAINFENAIESTYGFDYIYIDGIRLSDMTEITLSTSLTSIAYGATYGWDSLTRVNYEGTYEQWQAVSNEDAENINSKVYIDGTPLSEFERNFGTEESSSSVYIIPYGTDYFEFNSLNETPDIKVIYIPTSIAYLGVMSPLEYTLEAVYYEGTKAQWDEIMMEYVDSSITDVLICLGDVSNYYIIPYGTTSFRHSQIPEETEVVYMPSTITEVDTNYISVYRINYLGTIEQWSNISINGHPSDLDNFYIGNEKIVDFKTEFTITEEMSYFDLMSLSVYKNLKILNIAAGVSGVECYGQPDYTLERVNYYGTKEQWESVTVDGELDLNSLLYIDGVKVYE